MKIGAVYPQIEFPSDPVAIKEYAQALENLGYDYVIAYDHVLGANPDRPGGWGGPYNYQNPFQEPLLLFSFLAGVTQKLGFTTSIIILPQRQTALFAKQAATLDVLSGGRTRIGVGLGWNEVEYISLNEDFHNRGKRLEEQIQVLRLLWTQELVNFSGRWHTIPDAGVNPLPVQRPIPLWFGGSAELALRRGARLADGWMTNYRTPAAATPALETLRRFLIEAGRQPSDFGIDVRIGYGDGNPETWKALVEDWQKAGATHIGINTMGVGFDNPAKHLAALEKFAQIIR